MLPGVSRGSFPESQGFTWLGGAILNWGFLRLGMGGQGKPHRRSVEELPDHLRQDVGLLPVQDGGLDPRDPRW